MITDPNFTVITEKNFHMFGLLETNFNILKKHNAFIIGTYIDDQPVVYHTFDIQDDEQAIFQFVKETAEKVNTVMDVIKIS